MENEKHFYLKDSEKYNQILDDMVIKALNDAFLAGRSKQSFESFKDEWVIQNYITCRGCNCIVPRSYIEKDKHCYLCTAFPDTL